MSLSRTLLRVVPLALLVVGGRAQAKGDDDDVEISDDDDEKKKKKKPVESDDSDDEGDPDKPKAKQGGDSSRLSGKQDLTGHDLPTNRKANMFEQDRFFVDKVDSKKTRKTTLVQGSLTGTTFAYMESGGTIAPDAAKIPSASNFSRLFLDMRLQTDFRHISGSRWDGRIDVRGRVAVDPGSNTAATAGDGYQPADNSKIQSGFNGSNELEIRELWLIRNGHRSDVFFGRQFVPDLAGVKFDGLRIDYASSEKFTLLTFGGLYPLRGSRSVTTDYTPLRGDLTTGGTAGGGPDQRQNLGRFTGTAGGGAAYRTQNMYGAFGGVVIAPLTSEEQPRLFGTSTGYWRTGPKVDFYHFAVVDLLGSNIGITNLSAGLNFKLDQRLRATASINRVDTETLNLQAQAFLNSPDNALPAVQNEAFLARIAQNQARGSLSAGLGQMQRFEATTAITFRYRDGFTLTPGGGAMPINIPAGKSVEVFGGLTDRRSYKNTRIGADFSRIFRVGDANYQRTSALTLRGFASRELANGHGEWEGEIAYTSTKDDDAGKACAGNVLGCFGAAQASIVSLGGSLYYRVNRDWFAMGGLYLNLQSITHVEMMMTSKDPSATGVSGFFRFSRRF